MKKLLFFFLLYILFSQCNVNQNRNNVIGKKAPDISLKDTKNRVHSLPDYRGKIVLLNFWADLCAGCRAEMSKLQVFLDLYNSKNTKVVYKSGLRKFFNIIYPSENNLERAAEKYFAHKRDHEQDIQQFAKSINKIPPTSQATYLGAIKMLLQENDVDLKPSFWSKLRRRRKGSSSRGLTQDKVPSNVKLKKIITFFLLGRIESN